MTLDDDLRKALASVAPPEPSPAGVRNGLRDRMHRARRVRRIRVAAVSTVAGLAALAGTALAVGQIGTDDPAEIGPRQSLPAPENEPSTTPSTATPSTPPTTPDTPAAPTTDPDPTPTQVPPVNQPTTSAQPGTDTVVSGPHTTACGAVTFSYGNGAVSLVSRTVEPGYEFTTEGEGTSELHVKWDEGPGDECKVEAHLEDGVLEVQRDDDS